MEFQDQITCTFSMLVQIALQKCQIFYIPFQNSWDVPFPHTFARTRQAFYF